MAKFETDEHGELVITDADKVVFAATLVNYKLNRVFELNLVRDHNAYITYARTSSIGGTGPLLPISATSTRTHAMHFIKLRLAGLKKEGWVSVHEKSAKVKFPPPKLDIDDDNEWDIL